MKNEKYDNMNPQERDKKIIEKFKNIWITFGIIILAGIIIFAYYAVAG